MNGRFISLVMWMLLVGASNAMAQNGIASSKTLEIVAPKQFCARLNNSITSFAIGNGVERRQALRLSAKAAREIAFRLKSKTLDPFVDVTTLQTAVSPQDGALWLNTGDLIVTALGHAPERVLVVDQINDLRFTSHVMPRSQLLLVADDAGDLNAQRTKLVAATATSLGVKIHVIWSSSVRDSKVANLAQNVAFLASTTGGSFMDISNLKACDSK